MRHADEGSAQGAAVGVCGGQAFPFHVLDKPAHALGNQRVTPRKQLANAIGILNQRNIAPRGKIPRQAMVEPHVQQDPGVTPERCLE